jgi:hypothetical protein
VLRRDPGVSSDDRGAYFFFGTGVPFICWSSIVSPGLSSEGWKSLLAVGSGVAAAEFP